MREYKPHPLVGTGASDCSRADSHAWFSGARNFPEVRVHSRDSLALVNLAFHFGRVGIRYVEVALTHATST